MISFDNFVFNRFDKKDYNTLPDDPGVYKFFNASGIIYVGKAKNLKKRVSSYFTKSQDNSRKTAKLVSEVEFFEVTIVDSEFDALLLENSLIKENQPKYNILLKDDKSFPSICVSNDRFPRIYSTRRIDKNKGQYFGPYTSVRAMNNVLDLIHKLCKIRTCQLILSQENIKKKKFRVCLEYHIGNCLGPCEGHQAETAYLSDVTNAIDILKGNTSVVKRQYHQLMLSAAAGLQFEQAQNYKEKIEHLENFQSKSMIVQQKDTNTDVFTILYDEKHSFINFLKIEEGTIKVSETVEVKNNLANGPEEILIHSMLTLREKYGSNNKTILSNIDVNPWPSVAIEVPMIGDKKQLIDLSLKNVYLSKKEYTSKKTLVTTKKDRVLTVLQNDLQLKEIPYHIECFDNSNMQGTNPVASMVCFRNGKPSKKDYRKFNIKTVVGPDDFASMYEIVYRRYSHLKKENLPLPQLIVIDGGKGQLKSAVTALEDLGLYGENYIIGIAKRLEEIYVPYDSFPLHISKKSESLKLLQFIRDEAHRFAITFHRNQRSKKSLVSSLDTIPGIGPSTKEKLLKKYKSLSKIRQAPIEDLNILIGASKAEILKSNLN